MSLEDWVAAELLRSEATSANEIRGMLEVVERSLKDARVAAISDDLRFTAAYHAILNSASVALRAAGYRVPVQPGHHLRALDSLGETIGADGRLIRKLKAFAVKRGQATYDFAGAISKDELRSVVATAEDLYKTVTEWLKKSTPIYLEASHHRHECRPRNDGYPAVFPCKIGWNQQHGSRSTRVAEVSCRTNCP